MNHFWMRLSLVVVAALVQTSWGVLMPINLSLPLVWLIVGWIFWETGREKVLLWAFLGGLGLDLVGSGWVGVQALSLTASWGIFLILERSFLFGARVSQWVNFLISLGGYYLILWSLGNILPTI